jgi:hypothetical protein
MNEPKKYRLEDLLPPVDIYDVEVLIEALEEYQQKRKEPFSRAWSMLEELKSCLAYKGILSNEKT